MKSSKIDAEHYTWGNSCDGWHLLKSNGLSVIEEKMPPGTEERLHYHNHAQQFFYILEGEATFIVEERYYEIKTNEGFHIKAGLKHKLMNKSMVDLRFILVSEPKAHGDRIDLE